MFGFDKDGEVFGQLIDVMVGLCVDVLLMLFGGVEEIVFSLDLQYLVFVLCVEGVLELWLMNFDFWIVFVVGGWEFLNLMMKNFVWDFYLVFVGDDQFVWFVMKMFGYEFDCFCVMRVFWSLDGFGRVCEVVRDWDCLFGEFIVVFLGDRFFVIVVNFG